MSSKLPAHMTPIEDFMVYGVKMDEMDREDLLKVIHYLVDEMQDYKAEAEKKSSMLNDYLLGKSR